jgi:putative ABC transport system substrate-binding protein
LVADLVGRKVDVLFTSVGVIGARELKRATKTIPIVFFMGDDPVERGLVASLAQPGGNVTGVTWLDVELAAKRLDLMTEFLPQAKSLGLLVNPTNPNAARVARDTQKAAGAKRVQLHVLNASAESEIEIAFATLGRLGAGALVVAGDPFFTAQRKRLVTLAAQHAIPAMYPSWEFAVVGGPISYGASVAAGFRQAAVYVGRILKGAKPAELPVVQPTEFELVVNSKSAQTLGIKIPQSILLRADRVID